MRKRVLMISMILPILLVVGFSFVEALENYNYSMRIELQNTGGSEISGPFTFEIDAETLVNGRFMQSDGEDLIITTNSGTENLCAMALDSGGASWRLMFLSIPAYTSTVRTLYFGDTTATRDQRWIASGSDTCSVSDDNTLDFDTEQFLLEADLFLPGTPPSEQPIISKDGNYEIVVTGSPNIVMRVWSGTAPAITETSIPAIIGTEFTLQAWYSDGYINLSDGFSYSNIAVVGTLAVNANDVDITELAGTVDNLKVAVE